MAWTDTCDLEASGIRLMVPCAQSPTAVFYFLGRRAFHHQTSDVGTVVFMCSSRLDLREFDPANACHMFCFQSFLLKAVSHNDDGSTSIVKSFPCSAGSSTEICMVEVRNWLQSVISAAGLKQ